MSVCIPKQLADIVLKIMEESPNSAVRLRELTKELGEKAAQEINLMYEKRLLLKNPKIEKFIDSLNGIEAETKARIKEKIAERMANRKETIKSDELLSIIKDQVDRKFKVDVTPEQAAELNKLQIEVDNAKPGTYEYGKAKYDLGEKTTDIVNPTDNMSIKDQAKYNWNKTKQGWADLKDAGVVEKGKYVVGKTLGTAFNAGWKSLKATLDASFVAIQGGTVLSVNPRLFVESLGKSLSVFKNLKEAMKAFRIKQLADPQLDLMEKSGLRLPTREEQFSSHWAEKVKPVLGKIVKGSNDAFSIFLQNSRMGEFKRVLKNTEQNLGRKLDPAIPEDLNILKDLADHANKVSGTSNLGPAERYSKLINEGLFAARYTVSGVRLFTDILTAKSSVGRALAVKTLAYNTAAFYGTYYLLAQMYPDQTDLRPNSANFMKFKQDDGTIIALKPVDLWIVQLIAKMIANEEFTSKGTRVKYGEGYKAKTRADVALRTVRSKLAPVPAVIADLTVGKDFMGRETTLKQEAINLAAPIYLSSVVEQFMEDEEASKQFKLDFLNFFGVGAYSN